MDISLILNEIKTHLNIRWDKDFADFLEIKQNTLSTWRKRNTMDYNNIISKCDDIDANWLLTGKGNMFKGNIASDVKDDVNIARNSMSERLSNYIRSTGLTLNAFEKKIGVSTGLLVKAISNDSAIGSDKVNKIFLAFRDINIHWLITGEGLMKLRDVDNMEFSLKFDPNIGNELKRSRTDIKRYIKEIDMLLSIIDHLKNNQ